MNLMFAMINALGQTEGWEEMVFDWNQAARRIRETNAQEASAGLAEDWLETSGTILSDGVPVPRDEIEAFLASTWATPQLAIDGETEECFILQSETPGWGPYTYWPSSALDILKDAT